MTADLISASLKKNLYFKHTCSISIFPPQIKVGAITGYHLIKLTLTRRMTQMVSRKRKTLQLRNRSNKIIFSGRKSKYRETDLESGFRNLDLPPCFQSCEDLPSLTEFLYYLRSACNAGQYLDDSRQGEKLASSYSSVNLIYLSVFTLVTLQLFLMLILYYMHFCGIGHIQHRIFTISFTFTSHTHTKFHAKNFLPTFSYIVHYRTLSSSPLELYIIN